MKTNEMNNNKALNDDLLDEVTGGVTGGMTSSLTGGVQGVKPDILPVGAVRPTIKPVERRKC